MDLGDDNLGIHWEIIYVDYTGIFKMLRTVLYSNVNREDVLVFQEVSAWPLQVRWTLG